MMKANTDYDVSGLSNILSSLMSHKRAHREKSESELTPLSVAAISLSPCATSSTIRRAIWRHLINYINIIKLLFMSLRGGGRVLKAEKNRFLQIFFWAYGESTFISDYCTLKSSNWTIFCELLVEKYWKLTEWQQFFAGASEKIHFAVHIIPQHWIIWNGITKVFLLIFMSL